MSRVRLRKQLSALHTKRRLIFDLAFNDHVVLQVFLIYSFLCSFRQMSMFVAIIVFGYVHVLACCYDRRITSVTSHSLSRVSRRWLKPPRVSVKWKLNFAKRYLAALKADTFRAVLDIKLDLRHHFHILLDGLLASQ